MARLIWAGHSLQLNRRQVASVTPDADDPFRWTPRRANGSAIGAATSFTEARAAAQAWATASFLTCRRERTPR